MSSIWIIVALLLILIGTDIWFFVQPDRHEAAIVELPRIHPELLEDEDD